MYFSFRHRARLFVVVFLVVCFALAAGGSVLADCNPTDVGTPGSDIIICDDAHQPVLNTISGGLGNDRITVRGLAVPGNVTGDGTGDVPASQNGGNDTITIDGAVLFAVYGDFGDAGAGGGNDRITINGTVGQTVYGDYAAGSRGGGNDIIIVNGTVNGDVSGDVTAGGDGGDDTIVINGMVGAPGTGEGSVFGDDTTYQGGNDRIIIRGTVNVNVFGDFGNGDGGNDTIIVSGTVHGILDADHSNGAGGRDNVQLEDGASIDGVIDGGGGNDTLTFDFTFDNGQSARNFAHLIASLSPSGGSVTFDGHTYTWVNFERLVVRR